MLPRNYNNGIRIMQSPGYVIIVLEMAHEARIIPTNGTPPLDTADVGWRVPGEAAVLLAPIAFANEEQK